MLIRSPAAHEPLAAEITPARVWQQRRTLLCGLAAPALTALVPASAKAQAVSSPSGAGRDNVPVWRGPGMASRLEARPGTALPTEKVTSYKDITTYNNFTEFGPFKDDPARHARAMKTSPWSVRVEGLVHKPHTFDLDDLRKMASLEERVYRMRCVEGWSMVIPWIGYPLSRLIAQVEPMGSARFVEFYSHVDEKVMPGLKASSLQWPYLEALRLDEAQHPLTLLTFGLYGEVLPNQNGAPVRIVIPWKYGFKSGKSVVRIRFAEKQPLTSWMRAAPEEYGFYANVNPEVDHPRWSQATERRIGEDGFTQRKRRTLMFNGYGEQVASMYSDMNLRIEF